PRRPRLVVGATVPAGEDPGLGRQERAVGGRHRELARLDHRGVARESDARRDRLAPPLDARGLVDVDVDREGAADRHVEPDSAAYEDEVGGPLVSRPFARLDPPILAT